MSIDEAIAIAREVEAKEHRSNEWKRGTLVHEAFEVVIKAAESALNRPEMQVR